MPGLVAAQLDLHAAGGGELDRVAEEVDQHLSNAPFKPGGTLELLEAAPDVPVVPVTIDDAWKLLRHNLLPVPFGTRVRVRIGDPIPRTPGEDRFALLARAREEIAGTLDAWRKTDGDPAR